MRKLPQLKHSCYECRHAHVWYDDVIQLPVDCSCDHPDAPVEWNKDTCDGFEEGYAKTYRMD